MNNPLITILNKRRIQKRMAFFRKEREMVRRALERVAAASDNEVEIITAEEVVEVILPASSNGFEYRVDIHGAAEIYRAIGTNNYYKLVNGLGYLEEDDEFLVAMCLIDKCEEYGDYAAMVKAFKVFEYVVTHKKASSEVISFARRYIIKMREYLTELRLL